MRETTLVTFCALSITECESRMGWVSAAGEGNHSSLSSLARNCSRALMLVSYRLGFR